MLRAKQGPASVPVDPASEQGSKDCGNAESERELRINPGCGEADVEPNRNCQYGRQVKGGRPSERLRQANRSNDCKPILHRAMDTPRRGASRRRLKPFPNNPNLRSLDPPALEFSLRG